MKVLLALLLLATCAHADYAETEHRLKQAGVDKALRKRIHTAIDKAVAYLLAKQRKDGSWSSQRSSQWKLWHPREAETVFASLALRHAGTRAAKQGVRRGLEALVPPKSLGRKNLYRHLYIAGPMNMLLMADRSHPKVALGITEAIEKGQDKLTGWWGYRTFTLLGREDALVGRDLTNLSTTQFAALGMWAGGRVRGHAHVGVWTKHLESLIVTQSTSGSWSYSPQTNSRPYACGTFMGTANLLLALQGVGRALQLQPKLAAKAADAKKRAIEALHRDGAAFIRAVQGLPTGGRAVSSRASPYYTLYALEKACLFADLEKVGDVRWYIEGADILCGEQNKDGSWRRSLPQHMSSGNTISTCFALLFLLRSSRAYHPTTPRVVDLEKGPITGKSNKKQPAAGKPKPPQPPPIAATDAFAILRELRTALASRNATGLPNPTRVLALRELWSRVQKDQALAWRAEATTLLLTLIGQRPRKARDVAARWDALQVAGADVLTAVGGGQPKSIWRQLDAGPLKAKLRDWTPTGAYWNSVLSELLPQRGGDVSALRLLELAVEPQDPYRARTLAALRGLRGFVQLAPKTRYDLTREIIKRFEGLENARRGVTGTTDSVIVRWNALAPEIFATLRQLTRDPRTHKYAKTKRGDPPRTLVAYRKWLSRHKDVSGPPWAN